MIQQTIRLALRKTVRYPGLSLVTFLTLTIGIAVSAAIFAVAWTMLVRPFVFRNQDQIVALWANDAKGNVAKLELSYEEVAQLQKESKTLADIAPHCAANFPLVASRRAGDPASFSGCSVGEAFFRTLGIQPAVGRNFRAEEHRPDAGVVVMLSYDAWMTRFGGDKSVINDTLTGGGVTATIVGILPRHLGLPPNADLIFPMEPGMQEASLAANRVITAIARMRPGQTLEQVNSELAVISSHVDRSHPEAREATMIAYPLVDEILGPARHAIRLLLGMGVLVLVIAILNIASISVAQGVGRFDELGIRSSLGATRGRTALQLFIEFGVLALLAAAAAVMMARLLVTLLMRIAPPSVPRLSEVSIGWETVAFAFAAALVAAVVAALMQLSSASEDTLLRSLRGASRSASGRASRRFLELLAIGQVAVAVLTVVVASLLVQSFRKFANIDVGFARENVITFHVPRGYVMGPEAAPHHVFFDTALARIRDIPGVVAAGSVLMRPLEMEQGWDFAHTVEGQDVRQHRLNPLGNLLSATPGYFEAMGMRLLGGRTFAATDRPDTTPVAIVSESFAQRYWGGAREALGKRVKSGPPESERPWLTIVGVVGDVRYRSLTTEKIDIYVPFKQTRWSPNYFAVRTSTSPAQVIPTIRSIMGQLDREIPVSAIKTTHELVDAKLAQPRLSAAILALFAATATLLALIGLYGVLSYNVRRRSGELGVRAAVGATDERLAALIAKEALAITIAGTLIGLVASIASERVWRAFVYGVDGIDPAVLVVVAIGAAAAALIASALPALRAMRVDPVAALRLD